MLNFMNKNKFYFAAILLFTLLYFFGNNMEFYENSKEEKCESSPEKTDKPSIPYLDATDDIVLERTDLAQLQKEKIGKLNYDGFDNFPQVMKGWWASTTEGDIYSAPRDMVWPD